MYCVLENKYSNSPAAAGVGQMLKSVCQILVSKWLSGAAKDTPTFIAHRLSMHATLMAYALVIARCMISYVIDYDRLRFCDKETQLK